MPSEKAKDFRCVGCRAVLGLRDRDTMIAPGFTVEFKRRHRICCGSCGTYTSFRVVAQGKNVDKKVETAKL